MRISNSSINKRFDGLTSFGMVAYAVLSLTSMATMSIGAAIVITCILFGRGGPRQFFSELRILLKQTEIRSYLWASLALILACVISLLSARFYPLEFGGKTVEIHWFHDLGKMWYFFFPLILLVGWKRLSIDQKNLTIKAWIICFGVLSLIGIVQFFTGFPRGQPNPLLPGFYHPVLLLGHHLSVASIWIFPFFVVLDMCISKMKTKPSRGSSDSIRIPKNLLFLFLAAGFFTLIFGYSRTLWVALPLGLLQWCALRLPKKKVALVALVCALTVAFCSQLSFFQRRIQSQMGISDRLELWKANLSFYEHRPIFGVGFGKNLELSAIYFKWQHPEQTDFFVGHAHNIYLEVLAGTGIFGMLAWLFWNANLLRLLFQCRSNSHSSFQFIPAIIAAWIVLLLNGVTQVNFWEGKVLHQIMWISSLVLLLAVQNHDASMRKGIIK